jgi:hypothetical protein
MTLTLSTLTSNLNSSSSYLAGNANRLATTTFEMIVVTSWTTRR